MCKADLVSFRFKLMCLYNYNCFLELSMYVECKDWRYGCCEDRKNFADGPAMKGCASIFVKSIKISNHRLLLSRIQDPDTFTFGVIICPVKLRFIKIFFRIMHSFEKVISIEGTKLFDDTTKLKRQTYIFCCNRRL